MCLTIKVVDRYQRNREPAEVVVFSMKLLTEMYTILKSS